MHMHIIFSTLVAFYWNPANVSGFQLVFRFIVIARTVWIVYKKMADILAQPYDKIRMANSQFLFDCIFYLLIDPLVGCKITFQRYRCKLWRLSL